MGIIIFGVHAESKLQKAVQRIITTEKPTKIPKLNGNAPLNPLRFPLDIDIMLLGAGLRQLQRRRLKRKHFLLAVLYCSKNPTY